MSDEKTPAQRKAEAREALTAAIDGHGHGYKDNYDDDVCAIENAIDDYARAQRLREADALPRKPFQPLPLAELDRLIRKGQQSARELWKLTRPQFEMGAEASMVLRGRAPGRR